MNKSFILALVGIGSCLLMTGCAVFLTVSGYPAEGGLIAAAIPSVSACLDIIQNQETRYLE